MTPPSSLEPLISFEEEEEEIVPLYAYSEPELEAQIIPEGIEEEEECVTMCEIDPESKTATCVEICKERDPILEISVVPPSYVSIDQESLSGNVKFNGVMYATADLVEYLYSTTFTKRVPHTGQEVTSRQAGNVLNLIAKGYTHTIASSFAEVAYSVEEDLPIQTSIDIFVLDTIVKERMFVEGLLDEHNYYVNAFLAYAAQIAMEIGHCYKPAINFGIARYLNTSSEQIEPFPMGKDIDIIAYMLRCEYGGVTRKPENCQKMTDYLVKAFDIDRCTAERFSIPWAYQLCCALSSQEVQMLNVEGEEAIESMMQELSQAFGQRLAMAAYLTDEQFEERLRQVPVELLAAQAEIIPIEGKHTFMDCPDIYTIYESNLAIGCPLCPPMMHSIGEKALHLSGEAGLKTRLCDMTAKPSCIEFVRNCE
jgi:hypothetical protein